MTEADEAIERAYREEWTALLATLAGQLGGDVGLAEEAAADAFAAAVAEWPTRGVPSRPGAWLTTVARRRAIDRLRREATRSAALDRLETLMRDDDTTEPEPLDRSGVHDDRLRLLFTCCHPALALEARVALTLRVVGGLEVAEVSRALLTTETTMYQRLVRAKKKIKTAKIPYRVPDADELPARLHGVLHVIHLVYTEGHVASSGDDLVRVDLCREAIRLCRLVVELMPDDAEALGLLALLLLTDARRPARTDANGLPVSLEDQDRGRWDQALIAEGTKVVERALGSRSPGPFQVQAAVAALHAEAPHWDATDWPQIAALYGELSRMAPSPVVTINHAAALAMADGPQVGLAVLHTIDVDDRLDRYQPFHATRAELLARAGDTEGAAAAYDRAIELTDNAAERAALEARSRRALRS
ncbi:RNA polymerase sigma-70 factor (ECF subfamily) [Nocardioides thalensis]|uniref:RNA polymerase sigma-70 factor (ECF subfamily) n=1 Tax=Nocardioides thalensis TaxID=1914755 RepID=A0A853C5I9_9ACTN|nr:RNA polymerase sigma-70 factor (ECF subfamily) [Nocardioides thalensis]